MGALRINRRILWSIEVQDDILGKSEELIRNTIRTEMEGATEDFISYVISLKRETEAMLRAANGEE